MVKPEQAFGAVLRELRHSKALSQEKLALEANLERGYISRLERGLQQPSLTTILSLSAILGISAADIVDLVEKRLTNQDKTPMR